MDGLRERGIVDAGGCFTDAGRETKQRIEALTDELAAPPYDALSPAELDELVATAPQRVRRSSSSRTAGSGGHHRRTARRLAVRPDAGIFPGQFRNLTAQLAPAGRCVTSGGISSNHGERAAELRKCAR